MILLKYNEIKQYKSDDHDKNKYIEVDNEGTSNAGNEDMEIDFGKEYVIYNKYK